jgi:hypothetical protein
LIDWLIDWLIIDWLIIDWWLDDLIVMVTCWTKQSWKIDIVDGRYLGF